MDRHDNSLRRSYDPRIGDEALTIDDENSPVQDSPKIDKPNRPPFLKQESSGTSKESIGRKSGKKEFALPSSLAWIPPSWTWPKWKIVLRCAVAAWASLVLMVINPVLRTMGQAGFLVLIAAFLSPPSDPFVANLEREFFLLLFVCMAWGWSCLGIWLASLARRNTVLSATSTEIYSGQFIEAAPSVIMAVFLFLGAAFFLFIKARQGPGPFLIATIFGCICLDIAFTTAVLFPYAQYKIGQAIVVPLAYHSSIAILSSIFIFPSSVSSQYTRAFRGVVAPLSATLSHHCSILSVSTSSPEFSPKPAIASTLQAEGALVPLGVSYRLLKRDIAWGRFSPADLSSLRKKLMKLPVRANGLNVYWALIDPTRERFPVTPAPSRPASPVTSRPTSPAPSRPPSPSTDHDHEQESGPGFSPSTTTPPILEGVRLGPEKDSPRVGRRPHRRHPRFDLGSSPPASPRALTPVSLHRRHSHAPSHHSHHSQLLHSLHHLSMHHSHQREHVVGVFESQRYMDLESTHFSHPLSAFFTERATELLKEGCAELLSVNITALKGLDDWLLWSRMDRWTFWKGGEKKRRLHGERLKAIGKTRFDLQDALKKFRTDKRFTVLEPYRNAFSAEHKGMLTGDGVPPHRYLFHCFVYQYHLMRFSENLLELLDDIARLEQERPKCRLWLPQVPLVKFFTNGIWERSIDIEREEDEDPDIIQGMDFSADLGLAERRDPDALPPRNFFESMMNFMYNLLQAVSRGNVLFALKAAMLTVILSLPSLLKSSAGFAYSERFSWAIFMGQLTIARFRGDTTFGLVARIGCTFFGGLIGTALWYISTAKGIGNAYGLLGVCAAVLPPFFFVRLNWPGPPMINMIFFVTIALVVGFSWQNTHYRLGAFAAYGINLAWRRFVLVTAGVFAAFLFSFLPPSTTLRRYQRTSLSTTVSEIGAIYCSIVSFANSHSRNTEDMQEIVQSLIAIRAKLKRSLVLKTNIIYEFSMRGRWPADRYHKVLDQQLQVAYLLSHLMSVVQNLEPAWNRAFLRRTRFLDADFQGDVLAVISLISTALRTGNPLPQITPCPLLDRFIVYNHGLNIIRGEADDDYGLPRTMTLDALSNEQYLYFCVGISTAFGIVTRLDNLMLATKELVGEQYHIHGVGYVSKTGGVEMQSRTSSLRPARDV